MNNSALLKEDCTQEEEKRNTILYLSAINWSMNRQLWILDSQINFQLETQSGTMDDEKNQNDN